MQFWGVADINPGYSCSRELCESWSDYISDSNKYRINEAVDYKIYECYWIEQPVHVGNTFSGLCELFNFILT